MRVRVCARVKKRAVLFSPQLGLQVIYGGMNCGYEVQGKAEWQTKMEDKQMLEKDIVSRIMKYLKTVPRCFCWKEHGGMYGTSGIPDIIACVDGRFFAFEVKTETGKPTALQEATIRKILAAGGTAVVVHSVDEVRGILDATLQ